MLIGNKEEGSSLLGDVGYLLGSSAIWKRAERAPAHFLLIAKTLLGLS